MVVYTYIGMWAGGGYRRKACNHSSDLSVYPSCASDDQSQDQRCRNSQGLLQPMGSSPAFYSMGCPGTVHCSHLGQKKKWLTGKVAAREPFRKFEPNELARIHKRVIFSRDTNYPRMADVKSLLKWEFISMGGVTPYSPACYRASLA